MLCKLWTLFSLKVLFLRRRKYVNDWKPNKVNDYKFFWFIIKESNKCFFEFHKNSFLFYFDEFLLMLDGVELMSADGAFEWVLTLSFRLMAYWDLRMVELIIWFLLPVDDALAGFQGGFRGGLFDVNLFCFFRWDSDTFFFINVWLLLMPS